MQTRSRTLLTMAFTLCAAMLVFACGSGGGSSDGIPGGGGGGGGCSNSPGGGTAGSTMSTAEIAAGIAALDDMNAHRATLGLAALVWYAPAEQVAYDHSLRMRAEQNIFHDDPVTGTNACDRVDSAGLSHTPVPNFVCNSSTLPFVGENVACGYTSGLAASQGWIGSAGHLRQIVAPNSVDGASSPPWTHCTVGVSHLGGGDTYWTAVYFQDPFIKP